jgi:hypothetical protein
MDIVYLGLIAVFFAATVWLIKACNSLRGDL